jgi:hypothetical protein
MQHMSPSFRFSTAAAQLKTAIDPLLEAHNPVRKQIPDRKLFQMARKGDVCRRSMRRSPS